MTMTMILAIGVIRAGTMIVVVMGKRGIESGGIKPADRQQDFQRHVSPGRLNEPIAVEPLVEPSLDPRDLLRGDKIDLVEDEHVGECHLTKFQLHHLGCGEYLFRVQDAHDAVQPDAVPHSFVHERQRNAGRVGHSAGLEQDVFGPLGTRHYLRHRGNEIVADAAAHTAVGD